MNEMNQQVQPGQEQPVQQGAAEQHVQMQQDPKMVDQVESQIVNEGNAKMGPAQELQLEAYKDNATIAIYSEKTQPSILQMLQSSQNPVEALARTAFMVHQRLEASIKGGEKMTEITMALGAAHIVSELVVLAEAAGLYQLNNDQRLESYKHAIRMYFQDGLENGTIDPVELQKTVEPLMTQEQQEYGNQQMEKNQLSKTAPPSEMFKKGQQQGILGRR